MNYIFQSKDRNWQNGFKKKDTMVCCLQETHFSFKATHRLRVKRWRKIFQVNINQKTG